MHSLRRRVPACWSALPSIYAPARAVATGRKARRVNTYNNPRRASTVGRSHGSNHGGERPTLMRSAPANYRALR